MARKRIAPTPPASSTSSRHQNHAVSESSTLDWGSVVRGLALFTVFITITGFLVYPDVERMLGHLHGAGGDGIAEVKDDVTHGGSRNTRDVDGQSLGNGDQYVDISDADILDDDGVDLIVEDLTEEEILEKQREEIERLKKEIEKLRQAQTLDTTNQSEKSKQRDETKSISSVESKYDTKPNVKNPEKTTLDTQTMKGRPGRNPNSPPPIVLKAGQDGSFTLDPSQIRLNDDAQHEPEPVQQPTKKASPKIKNKPVSKQPSTQSKAVENDKKTKTSKNNFKTSPDEPPHKGRPGRDPNAPPPIVLKPGQNTLTLDPSMVRLDGADAKDSKKAKRTNPDIENHIGHNVQSKSNEKPKQKSKHKSSETKNKQSDVDDSKPKQGDIPKYRHTSSEPIVFTDETNELVIDPSAFEDEPTRPVTQAKSNSKRPSNQDKSKQTSPHNKDKSRGKASLSDSKNTKATPKAKDSKVDKVDKFKAKYQQTLTPKKVFVDGRRIPPTELLHQKKSNSSVRVHLFDDFLSAAECDGLIKAHDSHVTALNKQPIMCFDSVTTLRNHLSEAKRTLRVSPNDFTAGTKCLNSSFSQQVGAWLKGNWSFSTAFYPGESRFSDGLAARIEHAMGLSKSNGGKFQITSYPLGKAYKTHTDCTLEGTDKRDRVASVMFYLNDAEEGGETEFPELGIWVKPRKGRALVWNNMSPSGHCEHDSKHIAKVVKKGSKYILIRWYYYKSFQSLGHRPPAPHLPPRDDLQPMVMCDEYGMGSCRWYDEWTWEVMDEYHRLKADLQ